MIISTGPTEGASFWLPLKYWLSAGTSSINRVILVESG